MVSSAFRKNPDKLPASDRGPFFERPWGDVPGGVRGALVERPVSIRPTWFRVPSARLFQEPEALSWKPGLARFL